jgi:spore germination protein KA
VSRAGLEEQFCSCADFLRREVVSPAGEHFTLYWLEGMVKTERLNDYLIRPLMNWTEERGEHFLERVLTGGVWNLSAQRRESVEEVAGDLTGGMAAVFWGDQVLTCSVETEAKRMVSAVENEVAEKGAKDAFVESLQTNTALVRRRLRSPWLRLGGHKVGRESTTAVDVVWIEGLTNPALVEELTRRLEGVDIDALLSTGDLEPYLEGEQRSSFPRILFTERPDRFCRGILDGRVGLLVEGIPLGALLPGDLVLFLEAPQDREYHALMAGALMLLRCVCLVSTLVLPGFYIAVASFHFEMLPTKLALSIIASKQDVPFSTLFEVLTLLLAFEILQEAGLRLPKTIGQTVSILGGLVVGQAAVEAKIVSPAVVIVVAVAGITGFTMPNQDLANALRLWRFLLAALSGAAGFFGLTAGLAALVCHLGALESMGVPYLTPFAPRTGQVTEPHGAFRVPVPAVKLRKLALGPKNRRRQR